jgi:hypothetical protein
MNMPIVRTMSMVGLLLAVIGLAIIGGYMGLFLSGCLGFVFMYILVISLWIRRGDIHAVRMIHQQRIQAGDHVEVTITINLPARYWLCWIVVEECWVKQKYGHLPDKQEKEVEQYACLAYIRGDRNIKCHYSTSVKTRGLYRVHSSRVMIGDMFGLVKRVLVQEEHEAEIVQVNPIPLVGNWFNRVQQGGGAPTDYGTLRDYMSGDPISSIDWKSYARYQTLKTKQPEVEERKSMLIVMDARKAHFESIVSAATRMVLEMNDPTLELILACGDSRCMVILHQANQSAVSTETYEWLSSIEASSSDSFAEQLRTAMSRPGTISNARANDTGVDSNCNIIGVTITSDERIRTENNVFTHQQSIQIVYIPQLIEANIDGNRDGELNYA